MTPRLLWENVESEIQVSKQGYVLFDDTVLDKRHASAIELTRRQYSGNTHRVIRGIGLLICVYVNAEVGQFWGTRLSPLRSRRRWAQQTRTCV